MRKLFFLTLVLFTAAFFSQSVKAQSEAQRIELCTKAAGDCTFLSSYPVQLGAAKTGERPPTTKQATILKKGNQYRFTICTDEESSGEAVLEVYDEAKKIGSTLVEGKTYQSFNFDCNKTAHYVITFSFRDGKEGSAVGILSHVKTL